MERNDKTPPICPVCELVMMPTKVAFIVPKSRPAFSCYGCGVTAFDDYPRE
jgi:hypothetical protein